MITGSHAGMSGSTTARSSTATAAGANLRRPPSVVSATVSTAPSARLSATATEMAPWIPSHGMNTNPPTNDPAIAPTVFEA